MGAGGRAVETAAALCSGRRFAFPMGAAVPLAVRRDDGPDASQAGARSGSADAPCLERCGAEPLSSGVVWWVWWAVRAVSPSLRRWLWCRGRRLAAAQLSPIAPNSAAPGARVL